MVNQEDLGKQIDRCYERWSKWEYKDTVFFRSNGWFVWLDDPMELMIPKFKHDEIYEECLW
jgi:hypothetical protein